jgi:ABC-type spermidine/putrescine transport system permease subunit II
MSIQFSAIQDTIYAILVIAGIAVALSVAFGAAASLYLRGRAHRGQAGTHTAHTAPAIEHPTQTDSPVGGDRELVLR